MEQTYIQLARKADHIGLTNCKCQPPSKRLSESQASCSWLQIHIRAVESSPQPVNVMVVTKKVCFSTTKPFGNEVS